MPKIDYFFSTVSPNVYLAAMRLEEIAAQHGAEIDYRPLDTLVLFDRTGGVRPAERHENRKAYRLQELRRNAAQNGLPINLQPAHCPTNGAPAAYAVIAAQAANRAGKAEGDVGALVFGLTRACWAEERDVAEDAVIRECLAAAGFDPALADSGLLSGAETYAANLEEAVTRGVFGVPFYIVTEDDERFWGQDRLAGLAAHLATRAG
ncbi:MAG: 2-hydroxychromene-2-carboxylate isomerase [Pseudomonadota bacterium]